MINFPLEEFLEGEELLEEAMNIGFIGGENEQQEEENEEWELK